MDFSPNDLINLLLQTPLKTLVQAYIPAMSQTPPDYYAASHWTKHNVTSSNHNYTSPAFFDGVIETICRRLESLEGEVEKLRTERDDWKEKFDALWYAPGNPGYQDTKAHFEGRTDACVTLNCTQPRMVGRCRCKDCWDIFVKEEKALIQRFHVVQQN